MKHFPLVTALQRAGYLRIVRAWLRPRLWLCVCLSLCHPWLALAADKRRATMTHATAATIEEEVVVSGTRAHRLFYFPGSASVLSAADIATSTAQSLPELLAQEANINLQAFSSEKFMTLDMRGSGATSVSNVQVRIDGIKLNLPDLSGPDLTLLDMAQIERVEILRGGHAVRYGSGASQGIYNIFTRQPSAGSSGTITVGAGSYGARTARGRVSLASPRQSLSMDAAYKQGAQYRQHDRLTQRDGMLTYRANAGYFDATIKSRSHRDRYRLPGPLSRTALTTYVVEPRDGSIQAGLEGETADQSHIAKLTLYDGHVFSLSGSLQYRRRDNDYVEAQQLSQTAANDRNTIDYRRLAQELLAQLSLWDDQVKLTFGLERERSNYRRVLGNGGRINAKDGQFKADAHFLHLQWQPSAALALGVGYRNSHALIDIKEGREQDHTDSPDCETITQATGLPPPFDVIVLGLDCPQVLAFDPTQRFHWDNEAWEANAVWTLGETTNTYASYSESFRLPNIDELALVKIDEQLLPQRAERYETGLRWRRKATSLRLALFRTRTNNEIAFAGSGPNLGFNFNARTAVVRKGGELEATLTIFDDALRMATKLGYTHARSQLEQGSGSFRWPLVPYVTASQSLHWTLHHRAEMSWSTRYVGDRHDGNSFEAQRFDKQSSYSISDVVLRARLVDNDQQSLTLRFGVHNIFNRKYSPIAYSNAVYPATDRTLNGELHYAF